MVSILNLNQLVTIFLLCSLCCCFEIYPKYYLGGDVKEKMVNTCSKTDMQLCKRVERNEHLRFYAQRSCRRRSNIQRHAKKTEVSLD